MNKFTVFWIFCLMVAYFPTFSIKSPQNWWLIRWARKIEANYLLRRIYLNTHIYYVNTFEYYLNAHEFYLNTYFWKHSTDVLLLLPLQLHYNKYIITLIERQTSAFLIELQQIITTLIEYKRVLSFSDSLFPHNILFYSIEKIVY